MKSAELRLQIGSTSFSQNGIPHQSEAAPFPTRNAISFKMNIF